MANPALIRNVPYVAGHRTDLQLAALARPLGAALAASAYVAIVWAIGPSLAMPAKVVMIAFGLAVIGWSATGLNPTFVALTAALACSLALAGTGTRMGLTALADDTVLLIIGAFMLAAAIDATGIPQHLIGKAIAMAPTFSGLFFVLTTLIVALSFVIPSTSGRAALLVPTFLALRQHLPHAGAIRAIAIMIPAVIVLSSSATLISAGGNLVAAETVGRLTGQTIGYADWLLVHLPLAAASCFLTSWVILTTFVDRESRTMDLRVFLRQQASGEEAQARPRSSRRITVFVLAVMSVVLTGWVSQSWHGIPAGMIALAGALLVTLPGLGPVGFKAAVRDIDWSLILFLAASLQIGLAVIDSGLADRAANGLLSGLAGADMAPQAIIVLLALIGLCAHFVITSRTARTAAFLPPLLLIGVSCGLEPVALTHLAAAALGYCLTLVIGSKALVIFAELGGPNFSQRDLLRLATCLVPLHLLLLIVFTFVVWPMIGVSIIAAVPVASIIMPLPIN